MLVYTRIPGGIGFVGNLVDVVGHSAELPYVVHQLRGYPLPNDTGLNTLSDIFTLVNIRFKCFSLEGAMLINSHFDRYFMPFLFGRCFGWSPSGIPVFYCFHDFTLIVLTRPAGCFLASQSKVSVRPIHKLAMHPDQIGLHKYG